jgi:hypothetical protein
MLKDKLKNDYVIKFDKKTAPMHLRVQTTMLFMNHKRPGLLKRINGPVNKYSSSQEGIFHVYQPQSSRKPILWTEKGHSE